MTTIANSTTEIYLSSPLYSNPVVIDPNVVVSGGPAGIYASTGSWAIENAGGIAGTYTSGIGVFLKSGGSVTNGDTAYVIGGYRGVYIAGGAGSVLNESSVVGTLGAGVKLVAGGSVTNTVRSTIVGGRRGVVISGGAGSVVNEGGIAGTNAGTIGTIPHTGGGGMGVALLSGGSVTNAASAAISGGFAGVYVSGGGGTVVNNGNISSSSPFGDGVFLASDGSVINATSAVITGSRYGVHLATGGTLTNAGLIVGGVQPAVAFGGDGENLLVLESGYGFSGLVTGSPSASNTLELASASSAGVVTGLGTEFIDFGPVVFDAGAQWSITGNTSGLAGTISGFALGDTIEVSGVSASSTGIGGRILTLDDDGSLATLDLPGTFSMAALNVSPNADGTEVTLAAPCLAAGTGIACAGGERAVEALVAGEMVRLAGGGCAAVTWIGHRRVDCTRYPKPAEVWPVRVRGGAFGAGVPHRDVRLSPDHAVFVEGVLIPIRYLINGRTIVQEQVDRVTYYHVELASHAVILAEGLPCESYLDTGNRGAFANHGGSHARGTGSGVGQLHVAAALQDLQRVFAVADTEFFGASEPA